MPLPFINNGDTGLVSRNKINAGLALLPAGSTNAINTGDYGAVADGGSHPLSTVYATLADAQVVYPFVTALTQELDWASCKKASNLAFGADGSENGNNTRLNKPLHITAGWYYFGGDTWRIRNLVGGVIYGDGNSGSQISGNAIVLQFDGVWYTTLRDFRIFALTAGALTALDIDGNVPGHPYPTRGVQAIVLSNLLIAASGGTYAFTWCRQGNGVGGPGAQGDNGTFINLHLINAQTLYYQEGYNALNNQFLGGDFQVFTTGAFISNGTCNFIATSFESTIGFAQVTNSDLGYDIVIGTGGANEPCLVTGTRSESFRHFRNDAAQLGILDGVAVVGQAASWEPNTNYPAGSIVGPNAVPTGRSYFTAAGGVSAGVEPVWPTNAWYGLAPTQEGGVCGSTVVDNTVTWQEYIYYSIKNLNGNNTSVSATAGTIIPYVPGAITKNTSVNFDYNRWRVPVFGFPTTPIQNVNADATAGAVTIRMPERGLVAGVGFATYEITKTDTSLNPVIIQYGSSSNVFGDFPEVVLASPYERMRLTEGYGPGGTRAFYKEKFDTWSYYTPATVTAINAVTVFTINPQDQFLLDTSTGTITVNLAGPVLMGSIVAQPGMTFRIRDPKGTWNANNVTVNPQGYNIDSGAGSYVATVNNSEIEFTYIDNTIGWKSKVL